MRPKAQRSTRFEEEEREEQLETNGSVSHKQQYQVVQVEPTFLGTGRKQKEWFKGFSRGNSVRQLWQIVTKAQCWFGAHFNYLCNIYLPIWSYYTSLHSLIQYFLSPISRYVHFPFELFPFSYGKLITFDNVMILWDLWKRQKK